ncbi:NAD-dependent epimerase/dehydratase family protein [Microbacterium sp. zg-YB36]|uniref:NAD-dependent epimerase/dehydratase family protein n=1 Tax=Microbacterium sp. zg-YB36 TaxID=2969407 RepID=UPI00214AD8D8|nr:NAD-dependent epimerase/dehydratase family protein [Microbacterium sp. zg-YB36]MDL5352589.1 NAD-dependent epimerase/dehydratase family protein [Microbacterium sp. zg-YB36]
MVQHVLITGGAGFIGSHLARRFRAGGDTVTVLDALIPQVHGDDPATTSPLLRALDGVAEVIPGTVTSTDDLRRALEGASVVVHLAAETGTGQSMYEIDRYTQTNIGGTAKLLDLLANSTHDVRRVVVASSRAIYGEGAYRTEDGRVVYPPHRNEADLAAGHFDVRMPDEGPLETIATDEDAKLHPSSVYGITKQMQESLVMTVCPTVGIEPVSLRYQNVYGPGQSLRNPYTGILSIFSTLIRQGTEVNIFEDGLESRDFVYIDDVVEATFLAATRPEAAGGVFNVGSGTATTVLEVVDALFTAYGTTVPTRISGRYRLGDIRHNVADTRRLRETLGFAASVPFLDGVRAFADWAMREPVESAAYQQSLDEMVTRKLLR